MTVAEAKQTLTEAGNYNALVDDLGWCGHPFISLRTWACADCNRPVTSATRRRLEDAPTLAPDGSIWVLIEGDQDDFKEGVILGWVRGLFTDRARIATLMIRRYVMGADDIRDVARRTHWYQGVFNVTLFEGWEEEPNAQGISHAYHLSLERIDCP